MSRPRLLLIIFATCAVVLSAVLLYVRQDGVSSHLKHSAQDPNTRVVSADPEGKSQAVDTNAKTGLAERKPQVPSKRLSGESQAPDGYAYVKHHGRMTVGGTFERSDSEVDAPSGPNWLRQSDALYELAEQAKATHRNWTFAYAERATRASLQSLESTLESLGASVIGTSGRLLRLRVPSNINALEAITALDEIVGLAAVPQKLKLESLGGNPKEYQTSGDLHIYVTLMEGDPRGEWRSHIEKLGAQVRAYDPEIRAVTALASADVVRQIAMADFVTAIEPVGTVEAMHDTAVPAMGADALYVPSGEPGRFIGLTGTSVPIGVMDTGLNVNHQDIRGHRESICGAYFLTVSDEEDLRIEPADLWIDEGLHGTHVTGTIVGNGIGDPRFAGMAPGVQHIRFAKVLSRHGNGSSEAVRLGMDWLSQTTECGSAAVKPFIVNMSLGGSSRYWEGRSVAERKLDAIVWKYNQLYVVSQGNAEAYSFSDYGSAKNSLSVGATHDTGGHAVFTSYGPTFDGRLKPQVVGTGMDLNSAHGDGRPGGYISLSGTSMSSPSVAGVAALLMDADDIFKDNPALTRAQLMATAVRPDKWFEDVDVFSPNNSKGPGSLQRIYGLGKVSARTAVLDRDTEDGYRSGSATTELEDRQYSYVDIDVPPGTSRLDLVMTWDELPADTVSNSVLNDLDLWLDLDADCDGAECGEFSSTSRVDNVEWIIVHDPMPGTYRAKVTARAIYTETPRTALAWTVIRGPSTPQLQISASPTSLETDSLRDVEVSVSVNGYVAAGTQLRIDCRGEDRSIDCEALTVESISVELEDGLTRQLDAPSPVFGARFSIGEIAAGQPKKLRLRVQASSVNTQLRLSVDAWNAKPEVLFVDVGEGIPVVPVDSNDHFSDARELVGSEGSVMLDLYPATPDAFDPGPILTRFLRRPASSLWYEWTAPTSQVFHFGVRRSEDVASEFGHVSVFVGNQALRLAEIGSRRFNVSLRAEAQKQYQIRIASYERSENLELHWSTGRPVNDDFAFAEILKDATGEISGTTVGASLESGETWIAHPSTTWYRWTAPQDQEYTFTVESAFENSRHTRHTNSSVMVFRGDSLDSLRLISGYPRESVRFRARVGLEYRIAVAADDIDDGGNPYVLSWDKTGGSQSQRSSDDFEHADQLSATLTGELEVGVNESHTVQPDEPAETGVRTTWRVWNAPKDGSYIWHLEPEPSSSAAKRLRVLGFKGTDLQNLSLVGLVEQKGHFSVDMVAGESLYLVTSFKNASQEALTTYSHDSNLKWGPTPANDTPINAILISSEYGSMSGTNRFATSEEGLRGDLVGHSTVWWNFDAPVDGWYRFTAVGEGGPWLITVREQDDLDITASSLWQRRDQDANDEVLFFAEAGSRHVISMGSHRDGSGGEFSLKWDRADPPAWLRFAGQIGNGQRDSKGQVVELRTPRGLSFVDEVLYVATSEGLTSFVRDKESGNLTFKQHVDEDLQDISLGWDAKHSRFIAHRCGHWRSFEIDRVSHSIAIPIEVEVHDATSACGTLLIPHDGEILYRIGGGRLTEVFVNQDDGSLQSLALIGERPVLTSAVISTAGFLYGSTRSELRVYEMDMERRALSERRTGVSLNSRWYQPIPAIALSDDERLLFVVDSEATTVLSLQDALKPEHLGSLTREFPLRGRSEVRDACQHATARSEVSFEVFCSRGWGFVAKWQDIPESLVETERLMGWLGDRFNQAVPEFEDIAGTAVSPDRRHVYVSTANSGILIFERVGDPLDRQSRAWSEEPDLVVFSSSVNRSSVVIGTPLEFSTTVRNRGLPTSMNSTLRIYQSLVGEVPLTENEISSLPIGELVTGEDADVIETIALPVAGKHHLHACVDPVAGEVSSDNNCGAGIEVQVFAKSDLLITSIETDKQQYITNDTITLSVTVRNNGEGPTDESTILRYYVGTHADFTSDGEEIGSKSVGLLDPMMENEYSFSFSVYEPATYYYRACLDALDGELDATNNCSDTVKVAVSDQGSSFANAHPISIPSETTDSLQHPGDRDYFSFSTSVAISLSVFTTGTTDTHGTIFTSDEEVIRADDDSGTDSNFRIDLELQPGQYYIEVRGFTPQTQGPYVLIAKEST